MWALISHPLNWLRLGRLWRLLVLYLHLLGFNAAVLLDKFGDGAWVQYAAGELPEFLYVFFVYVQHKHGGGRRLRDVELHRGYCVGDTVLLHQVVVLVEHIFVA